MFCLIPPRNGHGWKDGLVHRVEGESCFVWFCFLIIKKRKDMNGCEDILTILVTSLPREGIITFVWF